MNASCLLYNFLIYLILKVMLIKIKIKIFFIFQVDKKKNLFHLLNFHFIIFYEYFSGYIRFA